MSLQKLVQETEYPPERPELLQTTTTRVVMIVKAVSPTPFALLRRANHFQYRDDDRALQDFAEYEDPVRALTDECRRVLRSISSANQSQVSTSKDSTGLRDASWSRFEDIGFSGGLEEIVDEDDESDFIKPRKKEGLRTIPHSGNAGLGRPTTPSWADFLSSGFVDEVKNGPAPLLLPPDKILPPIDTRGRSSQSHRPRLEPDRHLEPGELASITKFDLDDSFWWVWITSLAGEETLDRKAAFGRCALVETIIRGGRWLVMEEMVKGAAPEPEQGYIAKKKSFWGRSKKNKGMIRSKSTGQQALDHSANGRPGVTTSQSVGVSKTSIGPDQQARIQAAAIQLQQKQRQQESQRYQNGRRGRNDPDIQSQKTTSVFTLQPVIFNEATPAMKWANKYDKDAIRAAYLANTNTGTGQGFAQAAILRMGLNESEDTLRTTENMQRLESQDRNLPAVLPSALPPAPLKSPTPPPFPPTPAADEKAEDRLFTSEKAATVALPQDTHPAVVRTISPLPPTETPSPLVDPNTQSGSSPESKKHNKLKKKEVGGAGFRKMFGRNKNRQSQLPSNVGDVLGSNQNGLQPGGATLGRRFSGFRNKSPEDSPVLEPSPAAVRAVEEDATTPVASPNHPHEQTYDPSIHDSLSRVDTADAHEARQAFSSFDQGPLEDVPAFAPTDSPRLSEEVDAAVPPPISRSRHEDAVGADLTNLPSNSQDRWAQIRQNAAERAAFTQRQSEEQSRGGQSQRTDGDDGGETSGEESK